MTYTEQLTREYAAIRSRLYGSTPRKIFRPEQKPDPEPKSDRKMYGKAGKYRWSFGEPLETGGHRWREIVNEVAEKHDVCPREILGQTKTDPITRARFECWYRIKNETRYSYPQIGRFFGKDHSTVVHGAARWVEIGAGK